MRPFSEQLVVDNPETQASQPIDFTDINRVGRALVFLGAGGIAQERVTIMFGVGYMIYGIARFIYTLNQVDLKENVGQQGSNTVE